MEMAEVRRGECVQSKKDNISSGRQDRESIDGTQDFDDSPSRGDSQSEGFGDRTNKMSPPPSGDYYDDSHQPIYHRADESYKSTTKRSLGTAPYTMPDVGGNQTLTIKKFIGLDDVCNNKRLWRMLIAETIGTFLLIFIGCGSCIDWREKTIRSGGNNTTTTIPKSYEPNETNGQVVHIALTFGIAVATIAQALGHVSGAHLNPAVSVGLVAAAQCSVLKAVVYIIAQCVGAISGAAVLRLLTPDEFQQGGVGVTGIAPSVTIVAGLAMEVIITFVLVLTVCGVCDSLRNDVKGSAPLAIGLSITVCHFMAIRFTGSSMNPARSLGPAIVWGNMKDQWVYWVGPLIGGLAAGFIYQATFQAKEDPPVPSIYKEKNEEA